MQTHDQRLSSPLECLNRFFDLCQKNSQYQPSLYQIVSLMERALRTVFKCQPRDTKRRRLQFVLVLLDIFLPCVSHFHRSGLQLVRPGQDILWPSVRRELLGEKRVGCSVRIIWLMVTNNFIKYKFQNYMHLIFQINGEV